MSAKARAKALAKSANKDYAKLKRDAEGRVKTWQWATRATVDPEPTRFDTQKQTRGKKLASKPAKANYQAQEGFDAQGRLVVRRDFIYTTWNDCYETFVTYAPGSLETVRYKPAKPKHWESARVYTTDASGRVIAIASEYHPGLHIAMQYTLDERGFYARLVTSGGEYGTQTFEFDTNDKGKIIRTWWIAKNNGERKLYKGKAPTK